MAESLRQAMPPFPPPPPPESAPASPVGARWVAALGAFLVAAAATAAFVAMTLATGPALATAVTLTLFGTAVLFGPAAGTSIGPPTGQVLAVGLLGWAPIAAYADPVPAAVLGLVGAVALAEAAGRAVLRAPGPSPQPAAPPGSPESPPEPEPTPWAAIGVPPLLRPVAVVPRSPRSPRPASLLVPTLLTAGMLVPGTSGAVVLAAGGYVAAAAIGATGAAWLTAQVLDRATPYDASTVGEASRRFYRWLVRPATSSSGPGGQGGSSGLAPRPHRAAAWDSLALVPRVAALVPLAAAPALEPKHTAMLGGLVVGLALLDAIRLNQPLLVVGAGIGGPVAVVGMALASDSTVAQAGLGIMLTGVAWLGLSGSLPRRWTRPTLICAGIAAATGLALSAAEAGYLAANLLVLGIALAALGAVAGHNELVASGIGVATVGLWAHLALAQVVVSEPYLAPLALLLLAAGVSGHRSHRTGSWVAFAPSVGLLGGAGLLERFGGGPAWHALVAGGVGVAAVIAGGTWRLAGPLLVGTALVVATTIHETLDTTANLPAGFWLALGGTVLLAAGVAMERRGTGPYETGRRLVELVRERFV